MKSPSCSPGKLLTYIFYLSVFYFLLLGWRPAKAQTPIVQKSLVVGDTVPDVAIANILHYKKTDAKLSDFKGKLLIIDFWATWCSPCVSMIPTIDSLQKQFEGQVQFLSVTNQSKAHVTTFEDKYFKRFARRIQIPAITSDTVLSRLFYHTSIPHYVWINSSGVVEAVTELKEITAENISAFLKKRTLVLSQKQDAKAVGYNKDKPFLADRNGGDGSGLIFHSVLTGFTPGIPGGFSWKIDQKTGRKISVINCSRLWLYRIAYAKPGGWFDEGSVVIESRDSSRLTSTLYGQDYLRWLGDDNGFCYEIIVPASFQSKTNTLMQQDLKNFFPEFEARVITQRKPCLVLTRSSGSAQPKKSEGGSYEIKLDRFDWTVRNASLGKLVERLNKTQNYPLTIVDESGFEGAVDLDVHTGLSDLNGLNKELEGYGLRFEKKEADQQVLVIADSQNPSKSK